MTAPTLAPEQAPAPSRAATRRRLTLLAAAHHVTVTGTPERIAGLAQLRSLVLAARLPSRQLPA